MKLKPKDIITVIISVILMFASVMFLLKMRAPVQTKTPTAENAKLEEQVRPITADLNDKSIKKVEELTDYGKPTLENIGKKDPFGPLE